MTVHLTLPGSCAWQILNYSVKILLEGLNRKNISPVPLKFLLPIPSPVILFLLLRTSIFLIKMLNQLCLDLLFF